MNHKTPLVVAIASLMTIGFVGAGSATVPEPVIDGATFRLGATDVDARVRQECGGDAPLQNTCATDGGVRRGFSMTLGFPPEQPGFSGTTLAHLTHDGGEIIFQCSWSNGKLKSGSCKANPGYRWPNIGADFDYKCASFFDLPIPVKPPSPIPGGLGPWKCFIEFEG